MTKDRCTRCGLESYGLPARSLSFGRWRHTDTDTCLAAVGEHERRTEVQITELEAAVEALVECLPSDKRPFFGALSQAKIRDRVRC